jgi:Glutathione peroxidase
MAIYDHPVKALNGSDASLADYQGQAALVVNVASKCGLTPQYEGLQKLQDTYAARGFTVLGFPCNQFLEQEPGTADEIQEFCSVNYGVSFPLFAKIDVNGENQDGLFAELNQSADVADGHTGDIRWNFEKFLLSPTGEIVGRFSPTVTPEDPTLVAAIEAALPA